MNAPIWIIARRYITRSVQQPTHAESVGPDRYVTYDIQKDAFTEFVVVPDDDPRVDTVEIFDSPQRIEREPPVPDAQPPGEQAAPVMPLGIIELLMRVGEPHLKIQNLAASVQTARAKQHVVLVTFGTDQITPGDLVRLGEQPWAQLPMTGLIVWMPTALMQAAIRAHVAAAAQSVTVQ